MAMQERSANNQALLSQLYDDGVIDENGNIIKVADGPQVGTRSKAGQGQTRETKGNM